MEFILHLGFRKHNKYLLFVRQTVIMVYDFTLQVNELGILWLSRYRMNTNCQKQNVFEDLKLNYILTWNIPQISLSSYIN